jgi:predicted GIY-YIG superfamily endonuclease
MFYIYKLTFTNNKSYIGYTKNIQQCLKGYKKTHKGYRFLYK